MHVGCLAAAPVARVVVARVVVVRLVLLSFGSPMVILVCPGEESSLGNLVGTCLVALRSLCVVAVRLLMLSLLVLGLVELVLGTSCL